MYMVGIYQNCICICQLNNICGHNFEVPWKLHLYMFSRDMFLRLGKPSRLLSIGEIWRPNVVYVLSENDANIDNNQKGITKYAPPPPPPPTHTPFSRALTVVQLYQSLQWSYTSVAWHLQSLATLMFVQSYINKSIKARRNWPFV